MALGRLDDKSDEDIVAEINITPLTDIFLVLLIIFMITSSALIESGAEINLPEVAKTETVSRNVVVTLTTIGDIYINGKMVNKHTFEEELKKAIARPEVRREVLGEYAGGYLLGVTRLPDEENLVVLLQVEGEVPRSRRRVQVGDEEVEVVTEGGFRPVRPLSPG